MSFPCTLILHDLIVHSSWHRFYEPLRSQGKKLVAPAITSSSNQGQGLSWLDQFVAACSGCHFDAFAFHPYAPDAAAVKGSIDYFVTYKGTAVPMLSIGLMHVLTPLYTPSGGKYTPVWITEFGRSPDTVGSAGGADFVRSMLSYLDGNNKVQRYAYLARFDANGVNQQRDLQNADGSKTALGNAYVA